MSALTQENYAEVDISYKTAYHKTTEQAVLNRMTTQCHTSD